MTFKIDVNGILDISAEDKSTGKMQKIAIMASSGLSREEEGRMRMEAQLHAEEDSRIRALSGAFLIVEV